MQLSDKTAVIYGAAGAVGSAVAGVYAREGADVHLVGRTTETLERVAERIRDAGGTARVGTVDVLDRAAVERHAGDVVATSGSIDIAFNATSNDDVQGRSLVEMPFDQFLHPVTKSLTAHFNIATTVARHMADSAGGVILVMGGGREAIPRLGGAHVAWTALAGLCRQLAADLGPSGIRVAWLLSPGSPDAHEQDLDRGADTQREDQETPGLLIRHQPSYDDVAAAAAFLASDAARTMTATELNLTGGVVVD